MRKDLLPGKKWIKSRYNMIQFLLKVNFSFWFYSAYSTRWEEIFSPGRSGWKANRTWSNWSSCINRINKGADKALSAYQLHNERILLGQVVLRFYTFQSNIFTSKFLKRFWNLDRDDYFVQIHDSFPDWMNLFLLS